MNNQTRTGLIILMFIFISLGVTGLLVAVGVLHTEREMTRTFIVICAMLIIALLLEEYE